MNEVTEIRIVLDEFKKNSTEIYTSLIRRYSMLLREAERMSGELKALNEAKLALQKKYEMLTQKFSQLDLDLMNIRDYKSWIIDEDEKTITYIGRSTGKHYVKDYSEKLIYFVNNLSVMPDSTAAEVRRYMMGNATIDEIEFLSPTEYMLNKNGVSK